MRDRLATMRMVVPACWAISVCISFSCSSGAWPSLSDRSSPENTVILGRLIYLCESGCDGDFRLPSFELRGTTGTPAIPFVAPGPLHLREGQRVEVPIVHAVSPGTYEFRMKSAQAPPQSAWLEASSVTLIGFSVDKKQLVYIGTIEVDIRCERWGRQSATYCVSHSVYDDFAQEIMLFRSDFPELYELY